MGSPGSYRSYKPGGIQKVDRLLPPANSEPTERRMTFAEAIDLGGLDLRVAVENYAPSKSKDITEDRLRACANAGLTQYEVAKGFGATQPTISYHAGKWRIRFDGPTPEKKAWSKKEAAKIMARVVEEDEPEPDGSIEADQLARKDVAEFERRKPGLIVNEDFEAEFVKFDAKIVKEPPADEYTLVFSPAEKLAELVVNKDGDVLIRNCEMDLQLRYVLKFKPDLTGLVVDDDPKGFELRTKGNSFRIGCGAISKALTAAGIDLPARYRLDIEEMTGVLLS